MFRISAVLSSIVVAALIIPTIFGLFVLSDQGSGPWATANGLPDEMFVVGKDDSLTIIGSEKGVPFGESIAAGDVDGDGRDDVIIGTPTSNLQDGAGYVLIYFAREVDEFYPLLGHHDADVIIHGTDENDHFGASLDVLDMNGDGREDIIIGAPYADGPGNSRRESGEAYVISGRLRAAFGREMNIENVGLFAHVYGRDGGDHLGVGVRGGDLNDDGAPELVIRSEGYGGSRDGDDGLDRNDCFGSWEIEVIDGDPMGIGSVDLNVNPPLVRYFGSVSVLVSSIWATHIGNGLDIGDMDGDGKMDLAFSYQFQNRGYGVVFLGGTTFPGVTAGTSIIVHSGTDFVPDISLDLGGYGFLEASLSFADLDGDPFSDLIVGMPYASAFESFRAKAGQVDIYYGRPVTSDLDLDRPDANHTIYGMDSSDNLGKMSMGLDMNGDGIEEILVTAPGSDGIDNLEPDCGEAYLFDPTLGMGRHLNLSDSITLYKGIGPGSGAFTDIAGCEMIPDGSMELLVSTSYSDFSISGMNFTGAVSMLSQKSTFEAVFVGAYNASSFGTCIAVADYNLDGVLDVSVGDPFGSPGQIGTVHTFLGEPDDWVGRYVAETDTDILYSQAEEISMFGSSVATGDLDNDGYPDLAIGMPKDYILYPRVDDWASDGGAVRIYWGGTNSSLQNKDNAFLRGYERSVSQAGTAIAIGDLNGDGIDDIALSSPYDIGNECAGRYHAGYISVFFGPVAHATQETNDADLKIMGALTSEFVGDALAIGDIDNDGRDELIIGAPKSQGGSIKDQGMTYILQGRQNWPSVIDLASDPVVKIYGPWPYDGSGSSLATGDLDGDGKEELLIGAKNGDGFQRTMKDAGNVFILKGEYLASVMGGANILLRTNANVTICGDTIEENSGTSLEVGDIDGDGDLEAFIGAKGYVDTMSQFITGGVFIFPSEFFSESLVINTSSLPMISGFREGDQAGFSLRSIDVSGDGRDDLFIGAPGADPVGDGMYPGGVYYWEAKDLFSLDIRASPIELQNGIETIGPDGRSAQIIAPNEGPYVMRTKARSLSGYADIHTITATILSDHAIGSAVITYDISRDSFTLEATGDFLGQIKVDNELSRAWNDGVQSWLVDIAFVVNWSFPDPTLITTEASGTAGQHINYLNDEFIVDRRVSLDTSRMEVHGPNGEILPNWLNSETLFNVTNITLYHGDLKVPFSNDASDGLVLGMYRPDGLRIGTGSINGSSLSFPSTNPGDGISGQKLDFTISAANMPGMSIWNSNLTFELNIDSIDPPPVSSFTLFPDGKESGSGNVDDDRVIEVYWEHILDQGGSSLSNYTFKFFDKDMTLLFEWDHLQPGDIIQLPEGEVLISMRALDKAGNSGPWENRTMLIDVEEPRFLNSYPGEGAWLNQQDTEFSIEVSDVGSGADLTTAMYRIYRSDVKILGDWERVRKTTILDNGIMLNATAPEADGFGHYVQWKIDDLAGLTTVSLPFSYNMDTNAPDINTGNDDPLTVSEEAFDLSCFMEDSLSGLDLGTISYRVGPMTGFWDISWIPMELTGFGASASLSITISPTFSGWGYAQWQVSDVAGNSVISDLITIFIDDTLPTFTSFHPNGTKQLKDPKVTINAVIVEDGSGVENGDVEYAVSTISGWIKYGVGMYSPWTVVDELEDRGGGLYGASVDIVLDEGPFNMVKFRVRDIAGNGWVVSSPIALDVMLTQIDLPPTAIFNIAPATDQVYTGDRIVLDASASIDPEGGELTFSWYSDLENFPYGETIGTGQVMNTTLEKVGAHRLWVIVSDGHNVVESERYLLRVMETVSGDDEGTGAASNNWELMDILPYLILALILGLLLGAISIYLFFTRRGFEPIEREVQPMVAAHYDLDVFIPKCPYCDMDVKMSDEYCMKCGTVFSVEDKRKMEKKEKKKKKKKGRRTKKETLPEPDIEEEDLYGEEEYEEEEEELYDEDEYEEEEEELYDEDEYEEEEEELYDEDEYEEDKDRGSPNKDLEGSDLEDDIDDIEDLEEEDIEDMEFEEIDEDEWEVD